MSLITLTNVSRAIIATALLATAMIGVASTGDDNSSPLQQVSFLGKEACESYNWSYHHSYYTVAICYENLTGDWYKVYLARNNSWLKLNLSNSTP